MDSYKLDFIDDGAIIDILRSKPNTWRRTKVLEGQRILWKKKKILDGKRIIWVLFDTLENAQVALNKFLEQGFQARFAQRSDRNSNGSFQFGHSKGMILQILKEGMFPKAKEPGHEERDKGM